VVAGSQGLAIIARDDDMQEAIDKWIARKKLPKLLELWVSGLSFDWNKIYGDAKPQRINLPAYPFARERYWIDVLPNSQVPDNQLKTDQKLKSIEDTINEIDSDMMGTEQAVQALNMLV